MWRIVYADVLRVLATFAVIILHCAGYYVDMYGNIPTINWFIANSIDSLLRFSVPVFVMLSWMLLLSSKKEFDLKKRVSRVFIPLLSWSIIYIFIMWIWNHDINIFKNILKIFINPVVPHLWFPYMLIWLYILTPIIKSFITDKKNIYYILSFWVIFSVILPIFTKITDINFSTNFLLWWQYIWYFILWYFLHTYEISKKYNKLLLPVFLISYLVTIFGTYLLTKNTWNLNLWFYWNLAPNTILISISIFLLIKNKITQDSILNNNFTKKISEISYWMYLSHVILITILFKTLYVLNPTLDILVKSVIVIFVSALVNYILSKIRYIKYLFLGI